MPVFAALAVLHGYLHHADHFGRRESRSRRTINQSVTASVDYEIQKAVNPAAVTETANVVKGGNTINLENYIIKNGVAVEVSYAISGEANGCTLNDSILISGTNAGTVTVNITVAEDDNYKALAATPITVTITDKLPQPAQVCLRKILLCKVRAALDWIQSRSSARFATQDARPHVLREWPGALYHKILHLSTANIGGFLF